MPSPTSSAKHLLTIAAILFSRIVSSQNRFFRAEQPRCAERLSSAAHLRFFVCLSRPQPHRRRHRAAPVRGCPTAQFLAADGFWKISRTSTGARHALAALRPHASASCRSAVSSIQKPPTCSLVSKYGPSVRITSPFDCARGDTALGLRPPAKLLTPAAIISLLSAEMSRTIASPSEDGS